MRRKLAIGLVALTLAGGAALAAGASGSTERAAGALQVDAAFRQMWQLDRDYCPPGTPTVANCLRSVGGSEVAGLGRATLTYKRILPGDDENCFMVMNNTAIIEVAGKGTLELFRAGRICALGPPPRVDGPFTFTVTGGSGTYVRATGSLSNKTTVYAGDGACQCGAAIDTWTGTLTVPGVDFDTTPPTISGAASKTVRVPKAAKRVRVRYTVKAQDAVDGAVAVICKPSSNSFFKRGRTKVSCSATDSSANTSEARFVVTVK